MQSKQLDAAEHLQVSLSISLPYKRETWIILYCNVNMEYATYCNEF